jgi:hypothetical protein
MRYLFKGPKIPGGSPGYTPGYTHADCPLFLNDQKVMFFLFLSAAYE